MLDACSTHCPTTSPGTTLLGDRRAARLRCLHIHSGRDFFGQRLVVGIARRIATVERRAIVSIEWRTGAQPLRKIRVGDEHLPESRRVGFVGGKQLFGGLLIHLFVGDIDAAECCFQRGPEAAVAQRFT